MFKGLNFVDNTLQFAVSFCQLCKHMHTQLTAKYYLLFYKTVNFLLKAQRVGDSMNMSRRTANSSESGWHLNDFCKETSKRPSSGGEGMFPPRLCNTNFTHYFHKANITAEVNKVHNKGTCFVYFLSPHAKKQSVTTKHQQRVLMKHNS